MRKIILAGLAAAVVAAVVTASAVALPTHHASGFTCSAYIQNNGPIKYANRPEATGVETCSNVSSMGGETKLSEKFASDGQWHFMYAGNIITHIGGGTLYAGVWGNQCKYGSYRYWRATFNYSTVANGTTYHWTLVRTRSIPCTI